ncbi:dihydrofolate reductase family protein [Marinactinospora thermotolerans]|uniref:Dihydrofolate reductase n=1 Tax=Marinactinospora thermotolerans DSM 45154 TaxID=1122192 RepID=A0A1T4M5R7_9ACTN|nr:dihydrofolate reductase family protein [Marinactinospora thermotolerans]SJZ62255.1 Dihydrofolate reductase [Marinactinospora thermotolerans DSM 45154]
MVTGADTVRQCFEEGLVDEVLVQVAPIMLGDGIRLFQVPGGRRVHLEPISLTASGGRADLRYRVVSR